MSPPQARALACQLIVSTIIYLLIPNVNYGRPALGHVQPMENRIVQCSANVIERNGYSSCGLKCQLQASNYTSSKVKLRGAA